MDKMRRIASTILALVLCLAVVACGNNQATPSQSPGATPSTNPSPGTNPSPSTNPNPGINPTPGAIPEPPAPPPEDAKFAESIVFLSESSISAMDHHAPMGFSSLMRSILKLICDRLIVRSPDGTYEPQLATSWKSDDLKTYTFYLRDDVYFHNGQKFTSQDVVDTILSAKDSPGSIAYNNFRKVESVRAIDEYTVEIVNSEVNVDFLFLLASPNACIINKAAREADPIKGAWVGSGPYKITGFSSDEYVEITSTGTYWGEEPLTKKMTFRWVPEFTARTTMLLNGQADVVMELSSEDKVMFDEHPDFTVHSVFINTGFALTYNQTDTIMADLNFRKAVAHALELPDITMVAFGIWAAPPSDGAFWGSGTEFRNTDIPPIKFDLDLAERYLADSSYDGEEIQIMTGIPPLCAAAELMQEQLARIGINTTLFLTDMPTVSSQAIFGSTKTQIILHAFPWNSSASSAGTMFRPNAEGNRATYVNQEVIDLLDEGVRTVDLAKREAIYKRVQTLVYEDMAWVNLFSINSPVTASNRIGGIVFNPDSPHDYIGIYKLAD